MIVLIGIVKKNINIGRSKKKLGIKKKFKK